MQYPKFLFHKEQWDYSNDSFKIDAAHYMLHTANSFNIIKTACYIRRQKPDLVLIQCWHPYFAPYYYLLERFMGRQNLVFVCHNVFPHERFPMDKWFTRLVLKYGRSYIVHAKEGAKELEQIKKNPDYVVTPHSSYNAFRFEGINKRQARERLGIAQDKKLLLFFGYVREYKGLKYLLQALPEIVRELREQVQLWVVGEFGADRDNYTGLIDRLGIAEYINVVDTYTPDREVEKYFAAADLVVLPYISATQSGIMQIAYGFTKPVFVPNVGGLPNVVTDGKNGYVVEPENVKAIAQAVRRFYHNRVEQVMTENIKRESRRFSWERMGM